MLFVAAKLAWLVVRPSALLVLACVLGLAVRRLRPLLVLSVAALCVILLAPVDALLLRPLEDRFRQPVPAPQRVDGILVLGGALDTFVSGARGRATLNAAAERMTELVALARRYPDARLAFSGGSGSLFRQTLSEADVARMLWDAMGVDPGRVTYEDRSRTTHENAVLSRALVAPRPGQAWLLVTSAMHMPRAIGSFRAAGWPMTAWPVAYQSAPRIDWYDQHAFGEKLQSIDWAAHEYAGLLAYRIMGWTDALFPKP